MKQTISTVAVVFWLMFAGHAAAQASPASREDVAFFLGRWATLPAESEDPADGAGGALDCTRSVDITSPGEGLIQRTSTASNPETGAVFRVMSFAGRHPWWPADGGVGPVARRMGEDAFDLAPTRVGQADWSRAIRHRRCPAASQPPSKP